MAPGRTATVSTRRPGGRETLFILAIHPSVAAAAAALPADTLKRADSGMN